MAEAAPQMPGMTPQPAQGGPQQAPMGVSSVTGPTPNRGLEAAGMQRLGMVIKILTDLLPMVGATSEVGVAAMDAIKKFAKYIPAGTVSPASERNNIEQMAMRNQENSATLQQMKPQMGTGTPQQPPQAA